MRQRLARVDDLFVGQCLDRARRSEAIAELERLRVRVTISVIVVAGVWLVSLAGAVRPTFGAIAVVLMLLGMVLHDRFTSDLRLLKLSERMAVHPGAGAAEHAA